MATPEKIPAVMGRPRTGLRPKRNIVLCLDPDIVEVVDEIAKQQGRSRSGMVGFILKKVIRREPKPTTGG